MNADTTFIFPFRLGCGSEEELTEPPDELTQKVSGWLETALKTLGAGDKTAAGYGYFQGFDSTPLQKDIHSKNPEAE